jgi:hypothetical protein
LGASVPSSADVASWKSPVECPAGIAPAAANPDFSSAVPKGGIAEVNRIRSPFAGLPAIPNLHARHLYGTDTSLNGAFRTMTVTHKTIVAVRKLEVLHRLKKGLRLQFDGLSQ